jgi:hypothetical protein
VSFSADDPDATFECSLNGAPFAACTSPLDYRDLADGEHEVRVRAIDALGSADPTPATHVWLVAVPPETIIDDKPDDPSTSSSPTFLFSGSDNGTAPSELAFECQLDDGDWIACTSPHAYGPLADGAHSFAVRATDAAGNTEASPATHGWTIDTVAPQTTIESAPANPSQSSNASLTFAADEAARFECSLDDAAYAPCTSPQAYAALADGPHTFAVRATDAAGNVSSPASYTWSIDTVPRDTTAPETTIASAPAAATTSTSASFVFSASESGSSFECKLDEGAWAACVSPRELSGLEPGAYSFQVRAIDAAGNVDQSPASYAWTVLVPTRTAPQGSWLGELGAVGYALGGWNASAGDLVSLPDASVTLVRGLRYRWPATTDVRALQSPDGSTRRAAAWYDNSQLVLRLDFTAGYQGNLHLYAIDWDGTARRQTILVAGKTIKLDSVFRDGAWATMPIDVAAGASLTITVNRNGGPNAVLSGLFLGDKP